MMTRRLQQLKQAAAIFNNNNNRTPSFARNLLEAQRCHQSTYFRSGALKPKPHEMPFGMFGVFCAVVPGLFIGAAISKSVANFLEENDLFVPDDDDDDEY